MTGSTLDSTVAVSTVAGPPIFIVGAPRSGTTLLRLMIDSHPNIACGPESHILADLEASVERRWKTLERFGPGREYWEAKCRVMFEEMHADYAASKGKPRWADKTPTYGRHLPYVTALFPEAQIVHVIRDARMVTASVLARWGRRRAWDAPHRWVANVSQARAFGAEMGAERYRELRFEELLADTEGTLKPLLQWLGEPWSPQMLDYDNFDHDESPRNRTVREAARAHGGQALDSRRAKTPRRKLDPLLRARVNRIAGPLNRELGYR